MKMFDLSLYLVTDRMTAGKDWLFSVVEECLKKGVTALQLREKNSLAYDFYMTALKMRKLCDKYNIPLIINDRADIAVAVSADGVHVGQSDLSLREVQKITRGRIKTGLSVRTVEEAVRGETEGADYLGVGAVYQTATKKDAELVSLETMKKIKKSVSVPVVAIGGINIGNIEEIFRYGADGAAVVSAVLGSRNPGEETEKLIKIIRKVKSGS